METADSSLPKNATTLPTKGEAQGSMATAARPPAPLRLVSSAPTATWPGLQSAGRSVATGRTLASGSVMTRTQLPGMAVMRSAGLSMGIHAQEGARPFMILVQKNVGMGGT